MSKKILSILMATLCSGCVANASEKISKISGSINKGIDFSKNMKEYDEKIDKCLDEIEKLVNDNPGILSQFFLKFSHKDYVNFFSIIAQTNSQFEGDQSNKNLDEFLKTFLSVMPKVNSNGGGIIPRSGGMKISSKKTESQKSAQLIKGRDKSVEQMFCKLQDLKALVRKYIHCVHERKLWVRCSVGNDQLDKMTADPNTIQNTILLESYVKNCASFLSPQYEWESAVNLDHMDGTSLKYLFKILLLDNCGDAALEMDTVMSIGDKLIKSFCEAVEKKCKDANKDIVIPDCSKALQEMKKQLDSIVQLRAVGI